MRLESFDDGLEGASAKGGLGVVRGEGREGLGVIGGGEEALELERLMVAYEGQRGRMAIVDQRGYQKSRRFLIEDWGEHRYIESLALVQRRCENTDIASFSFSQSLNLN